MEPARQQGGALLLALVAIVLALLSAGAAALSVAGIAGQRDRASERALAQAREALIAYAADRPIDARVGPGYLPCPDLDDDGWAESTCGSLAGDIGQAQRLGRLPWKTLGLPDLRDGHGERLWYAVSTRYKGLLNCAASPACVAMTPQSALGTITLRDAAGMIAHDGTLADPARAAQGGAAAVVIAPGPALRRADGHEQRRDCGPGECDARGRCIGEPPWFVPRCNPRNYLDLAGSEDNAGFHDRSDAAGRAGNVDGFVAGPPGAAANDRVLAIAYPDVMARVMGRVALELAHCVRLRASLAGDLPDPEQACDENGQVGRIADAALGASACNARAEGPGWWTAWRPHVVYARAPSGGMEVVDDRGDRLAAGRRFAILVTQRPGECADDRFACDASGCSHAVRPARTRERHDALVAAP